MQIEREMNGIHFYIKAVMHEQIYAYLHPCFIKGTIRLECNCFILKL